MSEQTIAQQAGDILSHHLQIPAGVSFAIFVFTENPESPLTVELGYVTQAPLKKLRAWMRVWLRGTKAERVKRTVN